jgi:hypothetical protein
MESKVYRFSRLKLRAVQRKLPGLNIASNEEPDGLRRFRYKLVTNSND